MVATTPDPPRYRPLPKPAEVRFSADALPDAPPAFAVRFVLGLRRFLLRLADRLTPAPIALFEHSVGIATTAILGAVARHGIADVLDAGPMRADRIASLAGTDADATHRTLRLLANMGIFDMSADGTFRHNRLSRALRSGEVAHSRDWALYFSSGSNASAWLDFARSLETGESAFPRVHGMSVWTWFDQHADERAMFANAMTGITTLDAAAIATMYPFGELGSVCDVGGGRGLLLSEVLLRHPRLRGVLCDAAGVIEIARGFLAARGVADRCELVVGSFFERVPGGADAYLLKSVLHDWDDEACVKLLRVVREAARPGAKIVLAELLIDRNGDSLVASRTDLQMLVACDRGRERSADEIGALLERAGFRRARVFRSPTTSVVEGIAI